MRSKSEESKLSSSPFAIARENEDEDETTVSSTFTSLFDEPMTHLSFHKFSIYFKMLRESLVQLTNNLYRLTLLFPKKEPLRYKIREVADDILASPKEKDIETLGKFLEVALVQNWVSPSEILAIKEMYDSLKSSKKNPTSGAVKVSPQQAYLPERQGKILDFLKENGRAQVWQIKQVMPDVSKRTLRRDFEHLLKEGTIKRVGERNDTFYQLKTIQS